ncbi:HdeD family acid-resistance protein [Timonella senegalensis]|uniref:HdeD family acid-resistance protein n=1 Tax=Timonella senegalensis TaxID=1465825 RepID=UPI0028AB1182|nr:DUF308 domain-containing protein [Timonella senegalensis]
MPDSLKTLPDKTSRFALLVGGLTGVAFGLAILFWPTKAATALAGVIATYAIIAGIVYISIALLTKSLGTGGRVGHALLGILYIVAGIFAFSSLDRSAAYLAVLLTIMIGVMWVVEGFTALFTLGRSESKVLTIVFALFSVVAGATLLSSPIWGAVFLWWFLGIAMVALGLLNAVRALTKKRTK